MNFTDTEIRQNNARILALIPCIMPTELPKNHVNDDAQDDKDTRKDEVSHDKNSILVTEEEKAILWDIYNRPYLTTTERYETISIGD